MSPANALTVAEKVTETLVNAGYRLVAKPFTVASVPFEFAAALVGGSKASDLVVVVDTVEEQESRSRQKIEALGRALDVVRSRRPVTAVLVGPTPGATTFEAMARFCRVLAIGTPVGPTAELAVAEGLSVLLPLQLPQPTDALADIAGELSRLLEASGPANASIAKALVVASGEGATAVEDSLRALVGEPLRFASAEGGGP